jgi:hypothetical protein
MTIVKQSRTRLDRALAERVTTLLLISDETGDQAEAVHDAAEQVAKAGQRAFLVTDLSVLTARERKHWFAEGGHYAVVGGKDRVVAVRGALDELLLSDGKPSPIEIRFALAKGDRLP